MVLIGYSEELVVKCLIFTPAPVLETCEYSTIVRKSASSLVLYQADTLYFFVHLAVARLSQSSSCPNAW